MIVLWEDIAKQSNLSEEFMREHKHQLDWNQISKCQTLSEIFIEEMHTFINWNYISSFQPLSENFINNYQHKINWDMISLHQPLSKSYIEKHLFSLDFKGLQKNPNLSLTEEELQELQKEYIQYWKHTISFAISNDDEKTISAHFTHKFFPKTRQFDEIYLCLLQENNEISYKIKVTNTKGKYYSRIPLSYLFSSRKEQTIFDFLFFDFLLSENILTEDTPNSNKAEK